MTTALAPSDHARLSASGAHKWINCQGSVLAEVGIPDKGSKYADEGSAAHWFAAACLVEGNDAIDYLGQPCPEFPKFSMTRDMAEHVQTYLDYVRTMWMFCDVTWVEEKSMIDLPEMIQLAEDVGGTSDAGGINYDERVMDITDLKFGRGVLVEIEGNEQFLIYGLSKYGKLSREQRMSVNSCRMTVIQPRADHPDGPIRTTTISIADLLVWGMDVLGPASYAALVPNAPRAAGDWCKFCRAKPTCETFRDGAFAPALPFTFEDVGTAMVLAHPVMPTVMSPERISEIYFALDRLEDWAGAFRSFVHAAVIDQGIAIPGVGVKRKRTNRKWLDEAMVADYLTSTVTESIAVECFERSPVSVAALEKLVKQYPEYIEFPAHLVTKDEGELTLCAAGDKGALTTLPSAASHFTFQELP